MINTVTDLKSRMLIESNTLKSSILARDDMERFLTRDQILIHDYQIANSVTINQILANCISNLKSAWNQYFLSTSENRDSYFKIISSVSEVQNLSDQTKLVLMVDGGQGTFYGRQMAYAVQQLDSVDGLVDFVNLDSLWFGIVRTATVPTMFDSNGDVVMYDKLQFINGMNDFDENPNKFGRNPFDATLTQYGSFRDAYGTFNQFVQHTATRLQRSVQINSVIDNLYCGQPFDSSEQYEITLGKVLSQARYIVCLSTGLYGLVPQYGADDGRFIGFDMLDIGMAASNFNREKYERGGYSFVECGFHTIDGNATLFVVARNEEGKFFYMFFNEDSYDNDYGFTDISSVRIDELVAEKEHVFSKVEQIKDLGEIPVAMTDYGFWDLEKNTTKFITHSYRADKTYDRLGNGGNDLDDKLLTPDIPVQSTDLVSQTSNGDIIWTKRGSRYQYGGRSYPSSMVDGEGKSHSIVGANENLAVYDKMDEQLAKLLVWMSNDQFNQMLFSTPTILSQFMDWLYAQFVVGELLDGNDVQIHGGRGEHYLYTHHADLVNHLNGILDDYSFQDMYKVVDDGIVLDKFQSVKKFVGVNGNLAAICQKLKSEVDSQQVASWAFNLTNLSNKVKAEFKSENGPYQAKFSNFVRWLTDKMTEQFPLLEYFRPYLNSHFVNDLDRTKIEDVAAAIDEESKNESVKNLQEYIRNKVQASLILGNSSSTLSGNSDYDGINSYFHWNTIRLNKNEVQSVVTPSNILKAALLAVKSTPMFRDWNSFQLVDRHREDDDLFKVAESAELEFAKKSGLLDANGRISVDWGGLEDWMFNPDTTVTPEDILKGFIRTQFYRPLFFSSSDFQTFTTDIDKYWCKTRKSYINHDGVEKPLVFGEGFAVDAVHSGLSRTRTEDDLPRAEKWNYSVVGIEYSPLENALEYQLKYDTIKVVDGKFEYGDVEFYTNVVDGKVNSIYFNQFQKQLQSAAQAVVIGDYGTFELNGVKFKIEEGILSVDPTQTFDENSSDPASKYKEFRQEIVDGRFKIDGVWYTIDGNSLKYAGVEDSKLTRIDITDDGIGTFDELEFRFSSIGVNWRVNVIKRVQTKVIDRMTEEWCEFDDADVEITQNQTHDWYLSNEICRIVEVLGKQNVTRLGDGVLFNGMLNLNNTSGTTCIFDVKHELQNGDIVTNGIVKKGIGGANDLVEENIGPLLDKNMEFTPSRLLFGTMVDGVVNEDANGDSAFVVKNMGEGNNNCNVVEIKRDDWNANFSVVENVGDIGEADEDNGEYMVSFDTSLSHPNLLLLTPITTVDAYGQNVVLQYRVTTDFDGINDYAANVMDDDCLNVVADGERYRINLRTGQVDKLVFNPMYGKTIDFTTFYSFEQLRENLLTNLKQCMMNQIVQDMVDNGNKVQVGFNPTLQDGNGKNLYLEMFSDIHSLDNYSLASGTNPGTEEYDKFAQVFKNNINDIDESGMADGKLFQAVNGAVEDTFMVSGQPDTSIVLVDEASINVKRVSNVDQFTYRVVLDVSMRVKKSSLDGKTGSLSDKYIMANPTVKDVQCAVTFVPKFSYTTSQMTYDVKYAIEAGERTVEYDQIFYVADGVVRQKFIERATCRCNVASQEFNVNSVPLADITAEVVSRKLVDIFTLERLKTMFIGANDQIESDRIVQIGTLVRKNPYKLNDTSVEWSFDGKWELGDPIPPDMPYEIIYQNAGNTVIEGEKYKVVEDEDTHKFTFQQMQGSKQFDIVPLLCHESDDYETNEHWDDETSIQRAAIGWDLVSGSELDENFAVGQDGYTTFLKFKAGKDPFESRMSVTNLTLTSSDFASANIATYNQTVADTMLKKYEIKNPDTPAPEMSYSFSSRDFIVVDNIYKEDEERTVGLGLVSGQEFRVSFMPEEMVTVEESAEQVPIETALANDWTIICEFDLDGITKWDIETEENESEQDDENENQEESTSSQVESATSLESLLQKTKQDTSWLGKAGKFTVKFMNPSSDTNRQAEITSCQDCVEYETLPDNDPDLLNRPIADMMIYTPKYIMEPPREEGDEDEGVEIFNEGDSTQSESAVSQSTSSSSLLLDDLSNYDIDEIEIPLSEDNFDNLESDNGENLGQNPDNLGPVSSTPVSSTSSDSSLLESKKIIQFVFRLNVDVDYRKIMAVPANGTSYLSQEYLVSNNGTVTVGNVFSMTDVVGAEVGHHLGYGYVRYPVNIQEVRDKGADARPQDYDRKMLYIQLTRGENSVAFAKDSSNNFLPGKFSPCMVNVLRPDQGLTLDGEIYDRFYEVEIKLETSPGRMEGLGFTNGDFLFGEAQTRKSIRANPTDTTYETLFEENGQGRAYIPSSIAEGLHNLVDERLKLNEGYFENALTNLHQFLSMVEIELNQAFNMDEIKDVCNFKYTTKVEYAENHVAVASKWKDEAEGLFGFNHDGQAYQECLSTFNQSLFNAFFQDYSTLHESGSIGSDSLYWNVLHDGTTSDMIYQTRNEALGDLYRTVMGYGMQHHNGDFMGLVFGDLADQVRYINTIDTQIVGNVVKVFFANGHCNVLSMTGIGNSRVVRWYRFDSSYNYMSHLLDNKRLELGSYEFSPDIVQMKFKIRPATNGGWLVKMANRDISPTSNTVEAFMLHCWDEENERDMWYLSEIDGYLYSPDNIEILDMAYEDDTGFLYVLFKDDEHVYRYDDVVSGIDQMGRILLQKELASIKIETRHSTMVKEGQSTKFTHIFIDYDGSESSDWTLKLYGQTDGQMDVECWNGSPGSQYSQFKKYNTIMFGDYMFNEDQLKFQNVSKNKDMFEMLDVNDVDGCYYGLFRNDSQLAMAKNPDHDIYQVFKSAPSGGVVRRLPYEIVVPSLYRTKDDLFALYAVVQVPVGTDTYGNATYRLKLQEVSVPDTPVYTHKDIDIQGIMEQNGVDIDDDLQITGLVMDDFVPGNGNANFFVLSNKGFHKISCKQRIQQQSIDSIDALKKKMTISLYYSAIVKHLAEMHTENEYFLNLANRLNQYAEGFTVFSLIPSEFGSTQDVGVIPDSKIDDTDTGDDHRAESIQVSTDILPTQGMAVNQDSNPGFVTAAVSSPATSYDSETTYVKSKRNPSLSGTGFYDYIYDTNGNVLLDLYSIPFIYRINSNNTYDLYINVPTTRTKYINRLAGSLRADETNQVLPEDTRKRLNFDNQSMPNNLEESTTHLRVYIDRKYISIGNVELVEISGNSIPLEIYRDTANDGFYDSIALESRWNGEIVEVKDPKKDINKVMLEFECYGTDSQSIHISGKTLINRALDNGKYHFG